MQAIGLEPAGVGGYLAPVPLLRAELQPLTARERLERALGLLLLRRFLLPVLVEIRLRNLHQLHEVIRSLGDEDQVAVVAHHVTGRIVAEQWSRSLGQQFIVENRVSNAGSAVALDFLSKQKPDGYQLQVPAFSTYLGAVLVAMLAPTGQVWIGALFVVLFAASGIGNGSTFRTIGVIFDRTQAGPPAVARLHSGRA